MIKCRNNIEDLQVRFCILGIKAHKPLGTRVQQTAVQRASEICTCKRGANIEQAAIRVYMYIDLNMI